MQYSFKALALLAISGLAVAQIDNHIPQCAKDCLDDKATTVGCAGPTDYYCLCLPEKQASLTGLALDCLTTKCKDQLPEVISAAKALCDSLPPKPATSAAPVPVTSAEPETSAAAPEPASSTEAPLYPTTSAAGATSAGTAGPTGYLPSSTPPPFLGGAAQAAAGAGSIFAAGLAVLAAI